MKNFVAMALLIGFLCASAWAQPAGHKATSPQQALDLADHGRCAEALPGLKRAAQGADNQLSYRAALTGARCAMTLQHRADALDFLAVLARKFPNDPEADYTSARYLSQLANETAEHLA